MEHMKNIAGNFVKKIRYSRLYRSLRSSAFKEHVDKQDAFYRRTLGGNNTLIFDVGANMGDHAEVFSRLSPQVVCVEPDLTNCAILKARFPQRKVTVVPKAVSDSIGIASFHVQGEGSAYNTLSQKWVDVLTDVERSRYEATRFTGEIPVETTTLDALIHQYGQPDFIKIDVEGFELAVVRGLSVPVKMLSVECNLPEFREETINIVKHVQQLDNRYRFNYSDEYNFYLDEFITAEEMTAMLQGTNLRFFEMFCKLHA